MRKYYIDNIRWMAVLVLFPYHAAMIWNNYDDIYSSYYIWAGESEILSVFIRVLSPMFMSLLLTIAGMSAKYSLEKRTPKQFLTERFLRLFVPLVAGILLIVPILTFFAEKFHNGYTGGYFKQLIMFFTKVTNLSGYSGGFTPGHLWFLLFLFVISLMCLAISILTKKLKLDISFKKVPFFIVPLLFVLPLLMNPILSIGGKSLGTSFALFMLGYYVLSEETVLQQLDKYRYILLGGFIVFTVLDFVTPHSSFLYDYIVKWLGVLAVIGVGRHSLNFTNRICRYFTVASFPIYILHQSILVAIGYVVIVYAPNMPLLLQFTVITIASFISTIMAYEIIKRIPVIRGLFGMKFKAKKIGRYRETENIKLILKL